MKCYNMALMNTRSRFPSLDPVPEIPPFPLPVTVFLQMQIMGFTLPCLTRGECNSRCGLRVQHQPLLWGTLTLGHPGNTSLVQNTAGHKCKKKKAGSCFTGKSTAVFGTQKPQLFFEGSSLTLVPTYSLV